ncbi:MAG: hypothetical protein ACI9U0_000714 [Flavobacteriales bacterium]|jgi:hypothetical protein|tara:strand:- start:10980 stop:12437 length:1458 start_codon:yes stop_codon:yes gene_type:complete
MNKLSVLIISTLISSFFVSAQNLGDFYQGGIIFYKDSMGKGLIVDISYLEANIDWIPGQPFMSDWGVHWSGSPGAVEGFIGAGQFNTNNLVEDNTNDYAVNLCYNSQSGAYSDWFLPSKNELWQMMLNINIIDSVIQIYGGDLISDQFHWSSTQASTSNAWVAFPYSTIAGTNEQGGPGFISWSKSNSAYVRAIRCINNDCSFIEAPTFGCMDSIAENYNSNAGANDFSCEYIIGCNDATACNFDISVTQNNSEFCDFSCFGCTDSEAVNYISSEIYIEDGSCLYCNESYQTVLVSYDSLIDNSVFFQINNGEIAFQHISETSFYGGYCMPEGCYNLFLFADCNITEEWVGNTIQIGDFYFTLDGEQSSVDFYIGNGSCDTVILGCTDIYACNFDYDANTDDGSCSFLETVYQDCLGNCLNDIDQDGICDEEDYDDAIGIEEIQGKESKLLKMIDLLGREQKEHHKGMLLFYIYENRIVEKRIIH